MSKPVVLCPLSIERRAIAKRLREKAEVRLIGPGAAAARSAVELAAKDRPPIVILFGLAGGLRDDVIAPPIGRVVDKDGRGWVPPCIPPGEEDAVTIVGMDEPVLHRARKRQMAGAYAAALVDMESHAFAAAATAAGLRWAIIRGVSDGPDMELPAAVTEWVDPLGRMRLMRVFLGAILNPGVIPAVFGLVLRGRPALKAAAGLLVETLSAEAGVAPPSVVVAPGDAGGGRGFNPIERQLGRKSARLNDPPPASPRKK